MKKNTNEIKKPKSALVPGILFILSFILFIVGVKSGKDGLMMIAILALIVFIVVAPITLVRLFKMNKYKEQQKKIQEEIEYQKRMEYEKYRPVYTLRNITVAGAEYHTEHPAFNKDDTLKLVPESNEHDSQAVAIYMVQNGQEYLIGYVPRKNNYKFFISTALKQKALYTVSITNYEELMFDVNICNHIEIDYFVAQHELEMFHKFNIKNKEYDTEDFNIGDVVEFEYDLETEKTMAFIDSYDLGNLSPVVEDMIDSKIFAFVSDINELDEGVKLTIELYEI